MAADDTQFSIPLKHQRVTTSQGERENLQGLLNAEALNAMVSATNTGVTVCGLTRRLNDTGTKAGRALLAHYETLMAEQRPTVPAADTDFPEGVDLPAPAATTSALP